MSTRNRNNENKCLLFTFGKEYELGLHLGFGDGIHKCDDGSGPSEIKSPVFRKPTKMVLFEYFLYKIYGRTMFRYYISRDRFFGTYCHEKGNHFHFTLMSTRTRTIDHQRLYEFYYISAPLFLLVRKLLTLNHGFRNTIAKWCELFIAYVPEPRDLARVQGRDYAFITFNRNRKNTLTIELRASESSIVLDLCAFALVFGIYLVLKHETRVDLANWRSACALMNNVTVDVTRNPCVGEIARRPHIYLMETYPVELSIPANPIFVEYLQTIIPLEEQQDAKMKRVVVKHNSFKYLLPVAFKGLIEHGQEYVNTPELIWLLKQFKQEYVNANRSREEFVYIMYGIAKRSMDERKFRYLLLDTARWLVEE